jgi:hypothetical protein
MADVWSVLLIVAFFGMCVGLVRGCDSIIGRHDAADRDIQAPAANDATTDEAREAEPVEVGR